jgi:hypothetical protein
MSGEIKPLVPFSSLMTIGRQPLDLVAGQLNRMSRQRGCQGDFVQRPTDPLFPLECFLLTPACCRATPEYTPPPPHAT